MSGALSGLRVIDCSRLIAGGVLATVLADHGADVIKVENPRGGDPLRTWLRERGELWWKVYARGKVVDVSLYEPLLSVLGPDAAGYALEGVVRQRHGNTSDNASPRGTYRTLDDKWIALSASTPGSATAVFTALGLAELLEDPRFATNDARVEYNELVDATLARAIGQRTLDEMRVLFESSDLTACPVYDIADITKDPHVVARGILIDVPDPGLGAVRMTAPTPRLDATPATVRWAGPELGAHNRDVYGALGLSDAELESLKRDGIV